MSRYVDGITDIFVIAEHRTAANVASKSKRRRMDFMSASWVVVRIADQIIVGHYRSRREAAERAYQFSKDEPHVAVRQIGPGWPGRAGLGGRAGPDAANGHFG